MIRDLNKERLQTIEKLESNTYIGKLLAHKMLALNYRYSDILRTTNFKSREHIAKIVTGKIKSPSFSSIVELSRCLEIPLDKFIEER